MSCASFHCLSLSSNRNLYPLLLVFSPSCHYKAAIINLPPPQLFLPSLSPSPLLSLRFISSRWQSRLHPKEVRPEWKLCSKSTFSGLPSTFCSRIHTNGYKRWPTYPSLPVMHYIMRVCVVFVCWCTGPVWPNSIYPVVWYTCSVVNHNGAWHYRMCTSMRYIRCPPYVHWCCVHETGK